MTSSKVIISCNLSPVKRKRGFCVEKRTNTAKWMPNQKRWQILVQRDGVRKPFYSYKPGRVGQREANAKADAWLDNGISGIEKVDKLYELFIDYKKRTTKEQWIKDESIGKNWILPVIGQKKIEKVTEGDCDKIILRAFEDDKAKKSLENIRSTLKNFLKFCRKHKKTDLNPEDIEIPNGAKVGKRKVLHPEHMAILFTSDKTMKYGKEITDWLINAYRFQVLTGMRPGENIGLEWPDILDDIVDLQRSVNTRNIVTTGKNDNAQRKYWLSPSAKKVLGDQKQLNLPDIRIFGDDLQEQRYRKRWYAYCDYNGIPRVTPYELRHTFVSMLKEIPEAELKILVGHSVNMDTTGTYSHVMNGDLKRISAKVEYIFQDILKSDEKEREEEQRRKEQKAKNAS